MKDGSGLSRHNAVSPYHFTQILLQISKENYFKTFKNSLAVAGKSGTLKGMGIGTLAEGNIFAKSGTVERGISYTGYVNTSSGKTLSFSIMFNNYNSKNLVLRQKISKLMAAMAGI
jgi:D-alanyl-D-alanine carboxypeptidase/D-alanyl-D-alanine-endopeptidase (penicillin-binding protein 4)